jgi:DNA-binding response OmpR family regulator
VKQKILLVEDQIITQRILEYRLNKEGYDVISCDNGYDAKEEFNTQDFNLVLTDMLMPKACGFELLNHIRNIKQSQTPVIVFSEISLQDKNHEAMKMGASIYIPKPFDLNTLIETIHFFAKF